jgi:hypothetical protein
MLEIRGLAPLRAIGDNTSGWSEIIGIHGWIEHPSHLWHDITFTVRRACGKVYPHTVRFYSNSRNARGVILIPVIDERVAIIKQFRVAVGTETWELARGFAEYSDGDIENSVGSLPAALVRELDEEVAQNVTISSVVPIGVIFENTGTHHSALDVSIVLLATPPGIPPDTMRGSQGLPIRLVSWSDLDYPSTLGICDAHSLAAIALAKEYLQSANQRGTTTALADHYSRDRIAR